MNSATKVRGEEQFAKGQKIRDLQFCSDAGDLGIQLMDAIDSAYDFFRFLQASTRGIANNQWRLFKDGNEQSGASGHRNRRCQCTVELLGGGHTEAGQLYL